MTLLLFNGLCCYVLSHQLGNPCSVEGFHLNFAELFNRPDHNTINDVGVCGKPGETARTQRKEKRLIFKLGTFAPRGLSMDFKFFDFFRALNLYMTSTLYEARAITFDSRSKVLSTLTLQLMKGLFPKRSALCNSSTF